MEDSLTNTIEAAPARYATFTSRFRAVLIDTAVVGAGIIVIVIAGDAANGIAGSGRVIWLLLFGLVFLYEPLFIWRRGATIGHAMNHLSVVTEGSRRTPGFGQAFARYILKVILGLPSFVTMALSRKHQAVHDWLTRTTVQLQRDADVAAQDFHLERLEHSTAVLPSRFRRATVMVAYLVGFFVVYAVILVAIDSDGCSRQETCTASRRLVIQGVSLSWLGLSLATIVATWKGLVFGARRVEILDSEVDTQSPNGR